MADLNSASNFWWTVSVKENQNEIRIASGKAFLRVDSTAELTIR